MQRKSSLSRVEKRQAQLTLFVTCLVIELHWYYPRVYANTRLNNLNIVVCKNDLFGFSCHFVKVLYATPSQDEFYNITDALEEQGMEQIIKVVYSSLLLSV